MVGEDWDPKPPYGMDQGYDRYPGYSSGPGYGGGPRQAPQPGYDFNTVSNSPLYAQGSGYSPYSSPYGMSPQIDDEGAKGMGIASMVLGICSLGITFLGLGFYGLCSVISLITSIVGVSLGGVALSKYKRTGALQGKGMAVAGVVMNSINLGLAILVLLFLLMLLTFVYSL